MISIKVILVGDSNCRKNALINKFESAFFDMAQHNVGSEFNNIIVDVDNKRFKIQLWDTSGQERFRSIASTYYRKALGAFVVYNTSLRSTFQSLPIHIKNIKECAEPNAVIMIIGNICNPKDPVEVTKSEGENFAKQEKLLFKEVSLEDTDDIFVECMHDLVKEISKRNLQTNVTDQMKPPPILAQEKQEQPKKKKSWFKFFNRDEADKKEEEKKEIERPKEEKKKEIERQKKRRK